MIPASKVSRRKNFVVVGFLIAAVFFFVATLLISFFLIIALINQADVPADSAPNIFMLGLVPPSILTFLLYTKVFGRFL